MLERKALMEEGLRRFGLVERAEAARPASIYYGISGSRRGEPIDQLDAVLLVSRLRKMGLETALTVFVAARYAQLNGRPSSEALRSEESKASFFAAASRGLGVPLRLLRTDDLWRESAYWEEAARLSGEPLIISSRAGPRFRDLASSFEPELLKAIPADVLGLLGPYEAPSLYRLLEVAEASFLRKRFGVEAKVGPASEQEYDLFIGRFMGVIQLRQPLDFRSRAGSARPIVPYIGKEGEERLFASDGKDALSSKVFALAQRLDGAPLFFGGFLNPFARIAALAVEAAAASGSAPVRIRNGRVSDGASMIRALESGGTGKLSLIAPVVAECLWAYLARPIQAGGGCS